MLEVFLINVNTISNFIRCIKESKVINELDQNSNERIEFLNILLTKFDEYQIEKNIEIYYDYEKCKNICQENENNEFIFVNRLFIDNMGIDKNDIIKKVNLYINKKDKNKIKFPNSENFIFFEPTTNLGNYKFKLDNNEDIRNSENQNNDNPSQVQSSSINSPINAIINRNFINNPSVYPEQNQQQSNNNNLNNNQNNLGREYMDS